MAAFSLQGRRIQGIRIVSIGLGGLGGWLDDGHAPSFEPHGRVIGFALEHPGFPVPTPDLRLVFSTLKGQSAQPGQMMFGAQFIDPSEAFLAALKQFMEQIPRG
jgi:hypothetical protein